MSSSNHSPAADAIDKYLEMDDMECVEKSKHKAIISSKWATSTQQQLSTNPKAKNITKFLILYYKDVKGLAQWIQMNLPVTIFGQHGKSSP